MSKKDKLLKGSIISANEISSDEINEMYQLFIQYYDNAYFDTFKEDLSKKDCVFMIRRKDSDKIVGFSTVVKEKMDGLTKGRNTYAVFSGDTLVDEEFWGTSVLHYTAIRYIIMEKLRNPTSTIFWFLISKGYKTYLAMANNLYNYYPCLEQEDDPEMKRILRTLCLKFYPNNYNEKTGLLVFGNNAMKLKENVAEITEEMKEKYPKIKFFERMNPTWREGTELPCTVELSFPSILHAAVHQVGKTIKKLIISKKKESTVIHKVPSFNEVKTAASSREFHSIPVRGSSYENKKYL